MACIGDFEILRLLGQGAFGQVFLCQHVSAKYLRAIKTLSSTPPPDSPEYLVMQNEIALTPRIIHPNVVRVYSTGRDAVHGQYLVEEFVDGPSLRVHLDSLVDNEPYDSAKKLMIGIAEGLMAINGIMVHRDIHPGNILLKNGIPKIVDFGLAKLSENETRTKTLKGVQHIHYKAPESWKLEKNSFLIDVYSAGLVFFELLTRRHPYQLQKRITTHDNWRAAHLFGDRPRLLNIRKDVPPVIGSLISNMMAVRAQDRPSWELVLDTLAHDTEVPWWLSLPGEDGRRANEAAERKRALLRNFEKEQEYFYRAACNRFICSLEDMVTEVSPHLGGEIRVTRIGKSGVKFTNGEQMIVCKLFGRLKKNLLLPVGLVLGGGYLRSNDHLINIVLCNEEDDQDFGGSWWVYPSDNPTTKEKVFYQYILSEPQLDFTAHAARAFSWLLHENFTQTNNGPKRGA